MTAQEALKPELEHVAGPITIRPHHRRGGKAMKGKPRTGRTAQEVPKVEGAAPGTPKRGASAAIKGKPSHSNGKGK